VVSPQVPTRRAVGQTVLDHEPHRQIDHAVRVVTVGWREISEVGVKVRATLRTVVLRIRDHEITRTSHVEMPSIVQRPLGLLVPIGLVTTTRTGVPLVIATVGDDLWLWEVCRHCNTFRGIGSIRTRTEHRFALLAWMLGPELYDKCLSGAILNPVSSLQSPKKLQNTPCIAFSAGQMNLAYGVGHPSCRCARQEYLSARGKGMS